MRVPFDIRRSRRSIMSALLEARSHFGADRIVLCDADERTLSYKELLRASFALGNALRRYARRKETIAIMLPTTMAAVVAFFAVHAFGRVPAMLNFTAGAHHLLTACATGEVKVIVTARQFIERAKLAPLTEQLGTAAPIVYLEDLRSGLSIFDKRAGFIGALLPHWLLKRWPHCDDTAAILFTSGTEGDPKGVALSHANLLANVDQVRAHLDIFPETDVLMNPMPTFHCFGLTVGVLVPLAVGVKTILYPSPLHAKEIVKRIRRFKATVLLSTDTFIAQYGRVANEDDLASLRLAVCGAERVRDETRQLLRRRCNVEVVEGYGVTETAAVVASNIPEDNRLGTVGKPVAGVECRLELIEGIADGGRLFVRGPNVMKGYLKSDRPGVLVPSPGGWHDTGDVVSIDEAGYLTIRGRAKRFAKVGGEMVSLTVVENCASALWPDNTHAAIALPDAKKGERIMLITDAAAANRTELWAWAKNHGVPELAVPDAVVIVENIPALGTGKPDYAAVTAIARTREVTSASDGNVAPPKAMAS